MNRVCLVGRLTREPEIRYSTGDGNKCVASFTLAVDRRYKNDGESSADFISCSTFGKTAEFLERYGRKGTKIELDGRIQTGSYTNKEKRRVYTTTVIADSVAVVEFTKESSNGLPPMPSADTEGFLNIPNGIDEELPFN